MMSASNMFAQPLSEQFISVSALKSHRFEEDLYECWNYHHRHQNAGQLYQ